MHWLSFFIGLLAGWLIELLIDFFYWRRRSARLQAEIEELREQLENLQTQNNQLYSDLRSATEHAAATDAQLATCSEDLQAQNNEVQRLNALLAGALAAKDACEQEAAAASARHRAEVERLNTDLNAGQVALAALQSDMAQLNQRRKDESERLTVELQAAQAELEDARRALTDARQGQEDELARLTAEVDDAQADRNRLQVELTNAKIESDSLRQQLDDCLADATEVAGPEPSSPFSGALGGAIAGSVAAVAMSSTPEAAPVHEDDLRKIEGIGPKIAKILKNNGIQNFAQLAGSDVERLQEILAEAGPRFKLADPATWPDQARLAADEAWDDLKTLQGQLSAGRSKS